MKRYLSTFVVALFAANLFAAIPAAHAASTVPETVQVKDPVNDSNFLNDQDNAYGTPAEGQGDNATAADAGSATDYEAIWYTNDADTVSVHILTQAPPSNLAEDVYYRVASNPGEGAKGADKTRGCIFWTAFFNGQAGAYTGDDTATVTDSCNVGTAGPATATVETLEDGTGVITLTSPRSYSPLFADGGVLTKTYGVARVLVVGPTPTTATAATSDTTKRGADYEIASGGTPTTEPPHAPKPCKAKGVAKGCKSKKPTPPASGCAEYKPGDAGKDAKTTVVTDAATKDAPITVQLTMDPGVGAGTGTPADAATLAAESQAIQNVQVDSSSPTTGLYVRAEFDSHNDDDLYLYNADGTEAAHAAGFNPDPDSRIGDGTGTGGHSEVGAEQLDGITTADCQGYTAELDGATTQGGTITFKFWLGDATYDPSAASAGGALPI